MLDPVKGVFVETLVKHFFIMELTGIFKMKRQLKSNVIEKVVNRYTPIPNAVLAIKHFGVFRYSE